jgi:hypothetical protein
MRNPNREIDKTYLSLDSAEERGLLHRDYIAHSFRWSHVAKYLNQGHRYRDALVLDVGCGKELPLAKLLYVNKMTPRQYVGVDANRVSIPEMLQDKKIPIKMWWETDFCDLEPEDVGIREDGYVGGTGGILALPNVLVCFEVLEHVTPSHCRRMLQHFQATTSPDCHYFISTPCYNGSAAANHLSECTFNALGSLLEDLNYKIEGVYGTFASISDYQDQLSCVTTYDKDSGKKIADTDLRPIFSALRNYYDTNVLSVVFAPLFPAHARNCLWHLTKKKLSSDDQAQERIFSKLEQAPTPWSQHKDWFQLSGYSHQHTDSCLPRLENGPLYSCKKEGIWLTDSR